MDTATIHQSQGEGKGDMRIAELSRVSGVPVPTIKYYLRENLLPPGELTSPNQASYGESHLHRLRLIRALVDLAQVPVARVKEILEGLDSDTMSLHDQIGRAHRAITPARQLTSTTEAQEAAAAQVRALIKSRGWSVEPDAPAVTTLIETIAALRSLNQDHLAGFPRLLRRRRRKVHRTRSSRRHVPPGIPRPNRRIRHHRHHPRRNPDLQPPPTSPRIHLRHPLDLTDRQPSCAISTKRE